MQKKNSFYLAIKDLALVNPVLFRALSIHKTHKNAGIKIKRKSYLEGIYSDKSKNMVIKKSTQCGISEYLIIRAFYRAESGKNLLYILPTFDLRRQFVRERVDKTVMFTEYYRKVLNEVSSMSESVALKQFNSGTIAFVGSNTPNAFISYPADDIIVDELDNCNQENLIMAEERQSASTDKSSIKVGNPTVSRFGIDYEYEKSDKKKWFVKCEHCGEWINPDFFRNVVVEMEKNVWVVRDRKYNGNNTLRAICSCGKQLNRFGDGEWVAEKKSDISGYHISKMFSTQVTLQEIFNRFKDGLVNDSVMERVYNGDLGYAFTSKGAKIDTEMLDDCIDNNYLMPDKSTNPTIAGIDVGKVNNICIGELTADGKIKMVYIGAIPAENPMDIIEIFKRYNVKFFIVDAMPETRYSKKLIAYMGNRGLMNYYGSDKEDLGKPNEKKAVSNSRTQTLDLVKEYILMKNIIFPVNAKNIKDFYFQIMSSTRIYNEKRNCYDWVESGEDHYLHALGYLIMAKRYLSVM